MCKYLSPPLRGFRFLGRQRTLKMSGPPSLDSGTSVSNHRYPINSRFLDFQLGPAAMRLNRRDRDDLVSPHVILYADSSCVRLLRRCAIFSCSKLCSRNARNGARNGAGNGARNRARNGA